MWTSSLLLLAGLSAAGVVIVDAGSLLAYQLSAAGAPFGTTIEGLAAGPTFQRSLLNDKAALDTAGARARAWTVASAMRLTARCTALSTIVLECTNMPPYAAAVRAATGRTVLDTATLLRQRFQT